MTKETCYRCQELIDLDKDLFCTLGTHKGKETTSMIYFHFNCWRLYFEDKTREKAQNIVNSMQEKMMPIAKQMVGKLTEGIQRAGR